MPSFELTDLVDWAADKPGWQRDALRRLLTGGDTSEAGLSELVSMAKAVHDATFEAPPPDPAGRDHVPPPTAGTPSVRLLEVKGIERANALGSGPIKFQAAGLSIVYGANGSGKSGVARILKRACYSRVPGDSLLSNVFEAPTGDPACAEIHFSADGVPGHIRWVDGVASAGPVKSVSVFDRTCGEAQVSESNFIEYTPEVLRVFKEWAAVVERVATALKLERDALAEMTAPLLTLRLPPETAAGRFMTALSAATTTAAVDAACAIGAADEDRLRKLVAALADDPKQRANLLSLQLERVVRLEELCATVSLKLSDEAVSRQEAAITKRNAARAASALALGAFQENSSLGGFGTPEWKALWEAARQYSEARAYPAIPFPALQEAAACVLCQRGLDDETRTRLQSFEEFVKAKAQQDAAEAEEVVKAGEAEIEGVTFPSPLAPALREAGVDGGDCSRSIRHFLIVGRLRRRRLLGMNAGREVAATPELPPTPSLGVKSDALREEVARLREAAEGEGRRRLQAEADELDARRKLSVLREDLLKEIARRKALATRRKALDDCRTGAITMKARAVASELVNETLSDCFRTALTDLGFPSGDVGVRLGAGDIGRHPYEVSLQATQDAPPLRVLSEGERTCVALAGFLAELRATKNASGIVCDDPISSMDHVYRRRVAEHLVRESKERQVIVLTHDIVFLFLLEKYSEELNATLAVSTVTKGFKGGHGRFVEGPPWEAMRVSDRISRMRNEVVAARRVLRDGDRERYEREASGVYLHLRQSWERATEELLLNRAIVRFGEAVETKRLEKALDMKQTDIDLVAKEMGRCSEFIHDQPGVAPATPPEPDIVEADITRLATWVNELRTVRDRR